MYFFLLVFLRILIFTYILLKIKNILENDFMFCLIKYYLILFWFKTIEIFHGGYFISLPELFYSNRFICIWYSIINLVINSDREFKHKAIVYTFYLLKSQFFNRAFLHFELDLWFPFWCPQLLHYLNYIETGCHFSKYNMFSVEPACFSYCYEKLASVCVWPTVCHW